MTDDIDADIETLLGRYRPAGPPPNLRQRILGPQHEARSFRFGAFWPALAAMLLINIGLYWATDQLLDDASARLRSAAPWTAEANEAVELLNDHGSGRSYVALALTASESARSSRLVRPQMLPEIGRNMQ